MPTEKPLPDPDDCDALLARSWRLFDKGKLDEALECARMARNLGTHRLPDCLAAEAWFLLAKEEFDAAERLLTDAVASYPSHGAIQWYSGLLHFQRRNLPAACAALERALAIDPGLDQAAVTLAWALHDLGRFEEALRWSRLAVKKARTPDRLTQLGWLLMCRNRPGLATVVLSRAVQLQPDLVVARLHLAHACERLRQFAKARKTLQEGLELLPDHPDFLLALGWLHHHLGEVEPSRRIAEQLTDANPTFAPAWHLLGVIWAAGGEWTRAHECHQRAVDLDPARLDFRASLADALRELKRPEEALAVLEPATGELTGNPQALGVLAQLLLDTGQADRARKILLPALPHSRQGRLWYLLAVALSRLGRPHIALLALRRASCYSPELAGIWRLRTWLHLENGDTEAARQTVERLLQLTPNDVAAHVLAAFVFAAGDTLPKAQNHAEYAVSRAPELPMAWRALALIRYRQELFDEADDAVRIGLSLGPDDDVACNLYRQSGWIAMAQCRYEPAEEAFKAALELSASQHEAWHELAELHRRRGDFASALNAVNESCRLKPDWPAARLLEARILADGDDFEQDHAAQIGTGLLLKKEEVAGAQELLIRLAAQGSAGAISAVRLLDRPLLPKKLFEALEIAQGRFGHRLFLALARLAEECFPDDVSLATAGLYAAGLESALAPADAARLARSWCRDLALVTGSEDFRAMPARNADSRLRVAYVAAHLHHALLIDVLVAHDPDQVVVFLYSSTPFESFGRLPEHVIFHDLRVTDLEASIRANRIDVVVDTLGVHPFVGQSSVLRALARRLAPVQCAWLGSWGSGGGLYDVLIADEVSLPKTAESFYEEHVVRIPGGQWCWTPPAHAPTPGPPPCRHNGVVTFGCPVRGLRISDACLSAWARILDALPVSRLMLMGHHHDDWNFRHHFAGLLRRHGLAPERVLYRPHLPHARHLAAFSEIDIALDSFPGNGGLCLLDALWMGVPVISRAGFWAGERQGASILAGIGHPEWICASDEDYVATAIAVAGDIKRLQELRANLRAEIASSPLVSAKRVAGALEDLFRQSFSQASDVASATSPKDLVRQLARRSCRHWLDKGGRLDFMLHLPASGEVPDLSVVIVLFNQAGLTRQTLSALHDQSGVRFEVIIVDNGSTDETSELLAKLDGVRMIRNAANEGFLLAANEGARHARGRHVLFLNNDAIVMDGALSRGVARLDADREIGAVGARIVLGNGKLQEAGCIVYQNGSTQGYGRGKDPFAAEFSFERDADFCSGAFLMIRRTLWETLGGFDRRYAPAYYEDTDLCLRVWASGHRVVYCPDIRVSHLEWGSSASGQAVNTLMENSRQQFVQAHDALLQTRAHPAFARPARDRWLARPQPRILVIDNAVPHMAIGGGLPRARSLIMALADFHVTLFPLWTIHEDWREVYASIPATIEVMLGAGAAGFERFLEDRTETYDILLVSRPPNMAFVDALWRRRPELFDGMRLIYDAEALFALRDIGKAALLGRPLKRQQARELLASELDLVKRARTVLAVSRSDAAHFRASGHRDVRLLAHSMATRSDVPGWEMREGLLFIGALHSDTPNEDGLLWFVGEVFPVIIRLLGFAPRLTVVGDCRSAKIAALHSDVIDIVGKVDDLTPFYDRARVFVAPARFAAGVPAKVIEAACQGIPVVASELLVRQLGWKPGKEILSASDPVTFARHVADLYCHAGLWSAQLQASQRRTEQEYAPQHFAETLREVIRDCLTTKAP